jgi:uncharacterized protein YqjF (DUF2071 family)
MPGVLDAVPTAVRQAGVTKEVAHRPWPLREAPWVMAQTWDHLLFAHWPVDPGQIERQIPDGLALDRFDGRAWLGITPFALDSLRVRGVPPLPYLSDFLELNVRTYVTAGGKPGIWFFSLDASSRSAVLAARRTYHLPYFHARMTMRRDGARFEYRSLRNGARFAGTYGPTDLQGAAEAGTLEHFLAERYCLYSHNGNRLYRAEIHHPPWPLEAAEAELDENTMTPAGIELPDEEPLLHYSRRQDVVVWWPEPV